MLERKAEAKIVIDKVALLYPNFNASVLKQSMIPLRQQDLAFYQDALKRAGMNETQPWAKEPARVTATADPIRLGPNSDSPPRGRAPSRAATD
jgi:hypothetical protein